MTSTDPVEAWARSGAMTLTGAAEGPPVVAPGDPAGTVTRSLAALAKSAAARTGRTPRLPDVRLLGERAAIAGLSRQAPLSCGGAFRAVPTSDGHVGLSLSRRSDLEVLPALLESDLLAARLDAAPQDTERAPDWVWAAVADWASGTTTAEAVERCELLALPVAGVRAGSAAPAADPDWGSGARVRHRGPGGDRREVPLVVDLTSLWAGPLCAHLLGLTGCQVVKVEAVDRPDGARRGPGAFFDLLHAGHQMVALGLRSRDGQQQLAELIAGADLVLEGSRPRALRQWGIRAEEVVDAGTSWLSITARGRDSDTIGFGDDVAVSAGLHIRDVQGTPAPCGDAIADPLTGVVAAAAAARALAGNASELIEVSMWHVARAAASAASSTPHEVVRTRDAWWVEHEGGRTEVAAPWSRTPAATARSLGADNAVVLR